MPHSIDTSGSFIKVKYWGTLTNKDIQEVLRHSLTKDGKQLSLADRLEDMRELSAINVGFGELWSLAVDIQGIQLPRTVKTAIITGNPVQYGIARMFQAILTHPQMKVEMFSDEVEADKWLSAID